MIVGVWSCVDSGSEYAGFYLSRTPNEFTSDQRSYISFGAWFEMKTCILPTINGTWSNTTDINFKKARESGRF